VQVVVLPITDRQQEYAKTVHEQLLAAGFRADFDDRKEKVNLKIRDAQMQKVPYMLVIGDREAEAGTVSVRHRKHADMGVKPVDEFITMLREQVQAKSVAD
jgi:threonyl-tRNA synthetase